MEHGINLDVSKSPLTLGKRVLIYPGSGKMSRTVWNSFLYSRESEPYFRGLHYSWSLLPWWTSNISTLQDLAPKIEASMYSPIWNLPKQSKWSISWSTDILFWDTPQNERYLQLPCTPPHEGFQNNRNEAFRGLQVYCFETPPRILTAFAVRKQTPKKRIKSHKY